MRYTIQIDRKRGNIVTIDSLLVWYGEDYSIYFQTMCKLIEAFSISGNLNKVYFKHDEDFTHAVVEVKL